MITFKHSFTGALLIVAIALSAWSILISKSNPHKETNNPNLPDAILENVSATILDQTGKPKLKMIAPKMLYYSQKNVTDITRPHVIVYRDSPEPWFIDSDFAKATQGISQILFWNNVTIHHPHDINSPVTTIQTNSLTIFPEKKVAETNQAITITQPATTIHAVGMLADMNNGTVKLLSQAKGEYVPNS